MGRIECHILTPEKNSAIVKLKELVDVHRATLDDVVLCELEDLCETRFPQFTEKRVDVSIAVDMITMAYGKRYDVAYLLSADGDYVPAVEAVKSEGRKVFAASPVIGRELKKVVDAFIPLKREWFFGLFV